MRLYKAPMKLAVSAQRSCEKSVRGYCSWFEKREMPSRDKEAPNSASSVSRRNVLTSTTERIKISNLVHPAPTNTRVQESRRHNSVHKAGEACCAVTQSGQIDGLPSKTDCRTAKGTLRPTYTPNGSRRYWSEEENEVLKNLVYTHGACNWARLAQSFEKCSAAQLRAHWFHTLNDTLCHRPYTAEEDAYILVKQCELGNCWATIAAGMEHRSGIGIKNRYRTLTKARLRGEI
mmetsp:Transcript_8876/g.23298  ORF Transcript_8876/g.23298 Transcript_8876/m.23298 type:complete len:233 (-) Transcript_8876:43-741(-)